MDGPWSHKSTDRSLLNKPLIGQAVYLILSLIDHSSTLPLIHQGVYRIHSLIDHSSTNRSFTKACTSGGIRCCKPPPWTSLNIFSFSARSAAGDHILEHADGTNHRVNRSSLGGEVDLVQIPSSLGTRPAIVSWPKKKEQQHSFLYYVTTPFRDADLFF